MSDFRLSKTLSHLLSFSSSFALSCYFIWGWKADRGEQYGLNPIRWLWNTCRFSTGCLACFSPFTSIFWHHSTDLLFWNDECFGFPFIQSFHILSSQIRLQTPLHHNNHITDPKALFSEALLVWWKLLYVFIFQRYLVWVSSRNT